MANSVYVLSDAMFYSLAKELVALSQSYMAHAYKHMQYVDAYDKTIAKYGITKEAFVKEVTNRAKNAGMPAPKLYIELAVLKKLNR